MPSTAVPPTASSVAFERSGALASAELFSTEVVTTTLVFEVLSLPSNGTLVNPATGLAVQIGDTFTEGEALQFTGIPHFAPELFRRDRLSRSLSTDYPIPPDRTQQVSRRASDSQPELFAGRAG